MLHVLTHGAYHRGNVGQVNDLLLDITARILKKKREVTAIAIDSAPQDTS